MTHSFVRPVSVLVTVTGLLALAGCGSTPGTPVPVGSTGSSSQEATSTSTDPGRVADIPHGFSDQQHWLCGLISADDATALSFPAAGKPEVNPDLQGGGQPQCQWRAPGRLALTQFNEGASIGNANSLPDQEMSKDQIAGRSILLIKKTAAPISCEIDVDSGSQGVVVIDVATLGSDQSAFDQCGVVRKLAETAMPKIPG